MKALLVPGQNEVLVLNILQKLLEQNYSEIEVYFFSEIKSWTISDLQKIKWGLAKQALQQGLFQRENKPFQLKHQIISRDSFSEKIKTQTLQADLLLFCPDSFVIEEEDLYCYFEPTLAEMCELLEQNEIDIYSEIFVETLQSCDMNLKFPALEHLIDELKAFSHLALSPETDVSNLSEILEKFRYLQNLELWQVGLVDDYPMLLEPLCHEVLKSPNNWRAHLALLLFKRIYSDTEITAFPHEIQDTYSLFLKQNKRYLQVLAPVKDEKITIVILTYNRLEKLKRAVNQVMSQTYTHWKLIIADGGSTDETPEWCQKLCTEHDNIEYLYKKLPPGAEGIRLTVKMAIEAIDTELFLFCPDDDYLFPTHLEKSLNLFKQYPWIAMAYGAYLIVDTENNLGGHYGYFEHREARFMNLGNRFGPLEYRTPGLINHQLELERLTTAAICPQGALYRKSAWKKELFENITNGNPDSYVKGWDYWGAAKFFSTYDIGYIPSILFVITSDGTTLFAANKTDFTLDWLSVLETCSQNYTNLFEIPYPKENYKMMLNHTLKETIIPSFVRMFDLAKSEEALNLEIEKRIHLWEKYLKNYRNYFSLGQRLEWTAEN